MEEVTIYSDKHHVKITTREFIADSSRYLLAGIAAVRMHIAKHYKYPPITLLLLGVAGMAMGIFGIFKSVEIEELYIGDILITANRMSFVIGAVFLLLGSLWLHILRDEYSIIITTNEGDKYPVSSPRKDYIHSILYALKAAIEIQSGKK